MLNAGLKKLKYGFIEQCDSFIQLEPQKHTVQTPKGKYIQISKCFTDRNNDSDRKNDKFGFLKLQRSISPRERIKNQTLKADEFRSKLYKTRDFYKSTKYLHPIQISQPCSPQLFQSTTPKNGLKKLSDQFTKLSRKLKSQCNLLKGINQGINQGIYSTNQSNLKQTKMIKKDIQEPLTPKLVSISFEKRRQNLEQKHSLDQSFKMSLSTSYSFKKKICIQDFKILKYLGQGKFGKVELAIHKATRLLYAIKTIRKEDLMTQELKRQLVMQIKIQSFLDHPNITKLYAYFHDTKNIYLICQFLSGGHLYSLLMKKKFLNQLQASSYASGICSAVGYMHDNNVIHRDLKPQNILLQFGVTKVVDFGWSIHSKNMRETCCGTPLYLSPEITQGQAYDNKTDVWTIGVLIFQLLTGKPPFKISIQNGLALNVGQKPKYPSYLSSSARSFLEALLEKDARDRASISDIQNHSFLKLGVGFLTC